MVNETRIKLSARNYIYIYIYKRRRRYPLFRNAAIKTFGKREEKNHGRDGYTRTRWSHVHGNIMAERTAAGRRTRTSKSSRRPVGNICFSASRPVSARSSRSCWLASNRWRSHRSGNDSSWWTSAAAGPAFSISTRTESCRPYRALNGRHHGTGIAKRPPRLINSPRRHGTYNNRRRRVSGARELFSWLFTIGALSSCQVVNRRPVRTAQYYIRQRFPNFSVSGARFAAICGRRGDETGRLERACQMENGGKMLYARRWFVGLLVTAPAVQLWLETW